METCLHINDITDIHEGTIICTDCGVIKDIYYENNHGTFDKVIKKDSTGDVKNMLEQLHLPQQFSETIENNLLKNKNKFHKSNLSSILNVKKLASEIYNTVNSGQSRLLLKDIANFSHLAPSKIKSKNISILDLDMILEKYTKLFNISFKKYTVIKEKIKKYNNTGFQPLTIIGSAIYLHLLEVGKKQSMKAISQILGISSISIQRFLKYNNEISSRS